MSDVEAYDVVVIGGGPAGSTVATLIADAGHKVLVVERAKFPRFHIGESLMPETYWTFERLGMLPKLRDSEFVKKYSVQFVTASGRESAPFFFEDRDPRECSQTWQVPRDRLGRGERDRRRPRTDRRRRPAGGPRRGRAAQGRSEAGAGRRRSRRG